MSKPKLRSNVAALVAATFLTVPVSGAGSQEPVRSVSVTPADTEPTDPNQGGWFFFDLSPGETGRGSALITNVGSEPHRVKLYLADLVPNPKGVLVLNEAAQTDVGAWGAFDEPEIVIPPQGRVRASFTVTPPVGADPGDHIGAVVAESEPQGTQLRVKTIVATRLYVTLPGDAIRAMEISSIDWEYSSWWPRQATMTITLQNTGRVRLRPAVTAGGSRAAGSEVLLSQSAEKYFVDLDLPWYGGPVRIPIEAAADLGLVRRANASRFVVPWMLVVAFVAAGVAGWLVRHWWIRRAGRLAELRADIRRLESLVAQRPTGLTGTEPRAEEADFEIEAILSAIKRAQRAGAQASLERLAVALHESGGDALDVILQALEKAGPENRDALTRAASAYGRVALVAHPRMARIPPETAADILGISREAGRRSKLSVAKPKGKLPSRSAANKASPTRAKRKPAKVKHKRR